MRVLIIIPAYNEENNIVKLISRLNAYNDIPIDIVVINDCSTDNTSKVCHSIGVKVIDLPCNLGIGGAVQTGYKYAHENNYDIAIQVDGDGQHDPDYLKSLIIPIQNNVADLVIGSRYINKLGFQSTAVRRIGIRYFSRLIQIMTNEKITDPTSGFRACNSNVIELFARRYPKDYPEPESLVYLKRNKIRVLEVPVIMHERSSGKSSINLAKSGYYVLKVSLAIVIDKIRKQTV